MVDYNILQMGQSLYKITPIFLKHFLKSFQLTLELNNNQKILYIVLLIRFKTEYIVCTNIFAKTLTFINN